jgi:2'-5' RNA ligase superfamily
MAHSIELLFDSETEAAIRRIWDDLANADRPSKKPAGRPHVTLIAAQRINADVDHLLAPIAQRLPLPCTIGAPVLFGRTDVVFARLVVPSTDLLDLHAEVHRLCGPHLVPGSMPNSLPGQWTAHVTLARRVAGPHIGHAVRIAGLPAEIDGRFAGLRRWDGDERVEHEIS